MLWYLSCIYIVYTILGEGNNDKRQRIENAVKIFVNLAEQSLQVSAQQGTLRDELRHLFPSYDSTENTSNGGVKSIVSAAGYDERKDDSNDLMMSQDAHADEANNNLIAIPV